MDLLHWTSKSPAVSEGCFVFHFSSSYLEVAWFVWLTTCMKVVIKSNFCIQYKFQTRLMWRAIAFLRMAILIFKEVWIWRYNSFSIYVILLSIYGCLRGLAVACWTTDHYHPCSNLGMGTSEGCFICDFASLTFGGCSAHLAYHVHKIGHKTSFNIIRSKIVVRNFVQL